MNIETILLTIDRLKKLRLQGEDDTLDKLILFWEIEANQHEAQVIQKNTEIFKMQLHQTIDLQDKEGFATYGYLPYKYITRVPGGWIYSNYDTEKDAYVIGDKLFVPFDNDLQK